ncbi:MAG: zinc ABC transporter substrate-binding protein [Desulfuromonadaceae bacterium]|nr:zinc ABC transporter substrate-binding protein [Desulfuromonadaceae bacterium]
MLYRLLLFPLLALTLMAPTQLKAAPLHLSVSVAPQKYLLQKLVEKDAQIQVIIRPGQNPTTWDPSPRQMATILGSDALFAIGVPFEDVWLPRLRRSAPQLLIVDLRHGIDLLEAPAHHHPEQADTATHDHTELDPHLWLDPLRCIRMAATMRDTLASLDPANSTAYQHRFMVLEQELEALHQSLSQQLLPLKGRRFMVFHPAWGYFAQRYGLEQVAIEQEGKEPGGQSLARLIEQARQQQIRIIFVQQQFSGKAATTLANQIGARVVPLDPLEENLDQALRRTAAALKEALKN